MLRHLPNAVTASRGLAGLVIAGLLVSDVHPRLAFVVFVGAMFTDLFDGALARRLGATGELGRWLDPISDKVLTNVAWLGLWWSAWAPAWIALPMVLRDVGIGLGYAAARRRGAVFEVSHVGRVALSFEGIALAVLLFHGPWIDVAWPVVGTVLGGIALTLSVWAVVEYAWTGPATTR